MIRINPRTSRRKRRGFTAIELSAVASIIAILALILIPIVRKRLESARQTAALDDLRSLDTAEMIASADTAYFFRLADLDNPAPDLDTFNNPASTPAQRAQAVRSVPNAIWNRILTAAEQSNGNTPQLGLLGALWNGPYITFNKGKFVPSSSIIPGAGAGNRFRRVDIDTGTNVTAAADSGPMPIFESGTPNADPFNDDDANNDNIPIDPWGQPYIFFGPDAMGAGAGQTWLTNAGIKETRFGVSVVYSTGPNGLPGDAVGVTQEDYFRFQAGVTPVNSKLGSDDDIFRIF